METDPKKSFPNKNNKNTAISLRNKLPGKNAFLLLIILIIGVIGITGLSGLLTPDKNSQKTTAITEMAYELENTQPITNDLYTTLKNYDSGATDSVTAINKLQADKVIVDNSILQMQSITPPDELQHQYSLVLSAMQDLSKSLGLGIDGIKTNNFLEIHQTMSLKNYLTLKFNEATNEVTILQYSNN
ncbi:MAG TPA: hypothetical protein VK426_06795 [Methanobacterium sp.]|nr:hypothetical protein [Methanobacterium sp.]